MEDKEERKLIEIQEIFEDKPNSYCINAAILFKDLKEKLGLQNEEICTIADILKVLAKNPFF